MNFKIYYDGGTNYAGDVSDAPAWGVLLIVEADPDHGRRIVSNGDYYVWDQERWQAKDFIGMIDYLAQPGMKRVLIGRMVPNEVFIEAYRQAEESNEFPVRTGFGPFEQRV